MKLGNDIIEIDRIRQAIEKSSSFKVRVYTIHEIEYCKSRNKGCYESFAGIYAAKEAFIKALGTGMRHGSWQVPPIVACAPGKAMGCGAVCGRRCFFSRYFILTGGKNGLDVLVARLGGVG